MLLSHRNIWNQDPFFLSLLLCSNCTITSIISTVKRRVLISEIFLLTEKQTSIMWHIFLQSKTRGGI